MNAAAMRKSMLQQWANECCSNERISAAVMSKRENRCWEWMQAWVNERCSNERMNECCSNEKRDAAAMRKDAAAMSEQRDPCCRYDCCRSNNVSMSKWMLKEYRMNAAGMSELILQQWENWCCSNEKNWCCSKEEKDTATMRKKILQQWRNHCCSNEQTRESMLEAWKWILQE